MSRSTIRQWLQKWFPTRLRSRQPARTLFRRLLLEPLEDRWVPSLITWGADTPGDWNDATKWAGGVVPGAGDAASIPFNNITVTHSTNVANLVNSVVSEANMTFTAGSLSIATIGTFDSDFTLTGGTLSTAGTVNLNNTVEWSGGTLSGAGSINMNGLVTLTGSDTLDTGTLTSNGNVTDSAQLTLLNNATIVNNAPWTLSFASDTPAFVGSGTFDNFDVLAQTSAVNNSVNIPVNNNFTIEVDSGTLSLNGGGTDNGNDDIFTDSTLQFGGGTYTLTTSSQVFDNGNVVFSGGETDISGGFTPTGSISVTGSSTANFTNLVNGTGEVTFSSLNMSGGNLEVAGTVTVTGATTATGGAITGGGTADLNGSVTITSGGVILDNVTVNTIGTVTHTNATLSLTDFATVNNNGIWNISTTFNNLSVLTGDGTFNNNDTITSNSPDLNINVGATLNNNGLVDVQTGSLTQTGFGSDSGTFTVESGATLVFSSTDVTFNAGTLVNGAGIFDLEDSFLAIDGNSTIASATFIFDDSEIGNSATLTFAPATQATWTFDDIFDTGVTIIEGATTISGNSSFEDGTLNNLGQVTQIGASLSLFGNGIVNNEGGATWALQDGSAIEQTGAFNNLGALLSSSSTTQNSISASTFTNSGSIDVQTGILSMGNGGTDTGNDTVESGATLQFDGGTYALNAGSQLTGAGSITFSGGEVDVSGGFTVTGAITVTGDGLANFTNTVNGTGSVIFTSLNLFDGTLTGASTITVTGPTAWSGSTMSGAGVTDLRGGLALTGPSTLDTRTLNNFGTATQTDPTLIQGTLTLANGAVVNNESSFTWNMNSPDPSGATLLLGNGTFNNFGTLNANSTVGITINVPFNNDGTVDVQSGTLTVLGDGVDTGTFTIASGSTLTFSAGSDTFANATVTGLGTFIVSGGETITVVGLVQVMSDSFTLDGSTLTGSGTVGVFSQATLNNSTMSGTGVTSLFSNSTISGNNTLDTRTLNNFDGTVTQNTSTLTLVHGAVINNTGESAWNLASTTDGLQLIAGNGTFNNTSELEAASMVNIVLAVPVNNNIGDIDVQSGTLTLLSGGQSTEGDFAITSGATLDFGGGDYDIDSDSDVNGDGNVSFTGGTTTVEGDFSPGGTISILDGATADFTNTVNNSASVIFPTLTLASGGILTGVATVTVTGATTWSGGTMSGAGVTNLMGTSTLSGNDNLDMRSLNNFGNATDSAMLTLSNGAVINNESGATWNLQNSANIAGAGTFNNAGTVMSPSGTATDTAAVFNNNGAVNVQGSLNLDGGGSGSGSFIVAAGGTLNFAGGIENLNAGSSVSGAGNINFLGGTVNVAGSFTPTGSIVIGSSGSPAIANFTGAATLSMLSLTTGGTLAGSGAVTVTGATSWSGGTMSGAGVTNLQGPTTLTGSETLDTRTLNNFSTITESGTLNLLNGATINNESGGVWNLQSNANIGANGTFNNASTVSLASNSMLAVTAFQQSAGTLKGGGMIVGNVVINGGMISPGFSPGTLTIQGNYTQNSDSVLNIEIDGTTAGSQYSVLAVSGTATLGGTLNIVQSTGFVPPLGAMFQIVTAGSVTGTFGTVNGLRTGNGETFTVNYGANGVVLGVIAPGVASITSPTPSGTYGVGAVITVTVTFNEPVTLSGGNLMILLNDGGIVVIEPFTNSLTATGAYTVASGQTANPLDTNSPLFLDTGATLVDAAGTNVTLSIPTGASLANNKTIIIMTGTPISPPPPAVPIKIGMVTEAPDGTAVWTLYSDITATNPVTTFTFGLATDIDLVGDWNGDGFDTVGVARPVGGGLQWTLDTNGDHAYDFGDSVYSFGNATDVPVVGDWTGSGTTKIGVVRPDGDGTAQWSLDSNGDGVYDNGDEVTTYGLATDKFGAGDWTGDGKDDLAVVRAGAGNTAEWILNTTGTGVYSPSDTVYTFGLATDTFIVGDWNGAGKTEIGVMRPGPNGTMTVTLDTNGDGVYDAGDQVFSLPASVVGNVEFGNWQPLAALTVSDPPNANVPPLQLDATFQSDVNLAISLWAQAGLNSAGLAQLRGLSYSVSTLGGGTTALDDGNNIVLDATAGGNGWSEGPTPQPGQIDLVTTLAHEMGHALGLPDQSTQPNDLMFESLLPGVRKTPTAQDVDAVFATRGPHSS